MFARATVINYHRLGGLNNSNLFSHRSGGRKSEIGVSGVLVSSEALSLDCIWPSSLYVFTWSFFCVWLCANLLLLILLTSQVGLGPTHRTSLYLNYFFKALPPNIITFWGTGGYDFNTCMLCRLGWGEHNSAHNRGGFPGGRVSGSLISD